MTTKTVWALGADDPEMQAIAELLAVCGQDIVYYETAPGVRVRPGAASGSVVIPAAIDVGTVVTVEAPYRGVPIRGELYADEGTDLFFEREISVVRIDHHAEGDAGFGVSVGEFLQGSSIGQVVSRLARMGLIPQSWRRSNAPRKLRQGEFMREFVGRDDEETWYVVTATSSMAIIPIDVVYTAAADHCLGAAYGGRCPGVSPTALLRWRTAARERFQGLPEGEIMARIAKTRELIDESFNERIGGAAVRDMRYVAHVDAVGKTGLYRWDGRYRPVAPDAFHEVPELPDAAAFAGVAYLAMPRPGPDGRQKIVIGGNTTPEMVQAFIDEWAPAQGLTGIYGDPVRGFAGGYLP